MKYSDVAKLIQKVKNEESVLVLDTNVFYELYSCTKDKHISLVKKIQDFSGFTYLMPQVRDELKKNVKGSHLKGAMKKRVNSKSDDIKAIKNISTKINDVLDHAIKTYGGVTKLPEKGVLETREELTKAITVFTNQIDLLISKVEFPSVDERTSRTNIPPICLQIQNFEPNWAATELRNIQLEGLKRIADDKLPVPGRGDYKKKGKYCFGDYVLYKEMQELAVKIDKNVTFITNDISKDDWMDENRNVHENISNEFHSVTSRQFNVIPFNMFSNFILYPVHEKLLTILIDDFGWKEIIENEVKTYSISFEIEECIEDEYFFISNDSIASVELESIDDIKVMSWPIVLLDESNMSVIFDIEINALCDVESEIVFSSKEPGIPYARYNGDFWASIEMEMTIPLAAITNYTKSPEKMSDDDFGDHIYDVITSMKDFSRYTINDSSIEYIEVRNHFNNDHFEDDIVKESSDYAGYDCGNCGKPVTLSMNVHTGYCSDCEELKD